MGDDKNVVSLASATKDAKFDSPEQLLRDAIKEVREGAFMNGNKMLILSLNDNNGYSIDFMQAGMKMSECVTLCEIAKTIFLRNMEYI